MTEPDINPVNAVDLTTGDEDRDVNGRTQDRNQNSVVDQSPQFRSFWKAGDYVVSSSISAPPDGELEHARVHPKFLHSNATSHKWAFGAIAELLDNAVDEICNGATFVKVDVIDNTKNNSPALLFQDDGGGMNPDCMRQCMSLGYSSKQANTTIGQYGNGFKTSTMRLGADVIVFSRGTCGSRTTQSIGLLSYTFLRRTGQDDVIVPMVDFEISGSKAYPIIYSSQEEWSSNLKLIIEWSPFGSQNELLQQFDSIGVSGTKVIIYNLWLDDDGVLELDFNSDEEDILLRDDFKTGKLSRPKKDHNELLESHISYRMRFSLKAYASVLYLRKFTNFRIILRGEPVQQYIIADNLNFTETFTYRPKLSPGITSKQVSAETTIGFVKEAPVLQITGFNVYHRNRLIRPFWVVTNDIYTKCKSAVGVIEVNFIEPAHNKQDFERSSVVIRLEAWLKQLIMKYWTQNCHLAGFWSPIPEIRNKQMETREDRPTVYVNRSKSGLPKGLPSEQDDNDFSAYLEEEEDGYLVELPSANMQQEVSHDQPSCGLTANSQPIIGLPASSSGRGEPLDGFTSTLLQQISDENIRLFIRRDEHIHKDMELKNTIEELKKELKEAKEKCSQLSSHLEIQRKHV